MGRDGTTGETTGGARAKERPPGPKRALRALLTAVAAPALLAGCVAESAVPHDGETGPRFVRVQTGPPVSNTASSPSASWVDADFDGDEDLHVLNGFPTLVEEQPPQADALYRNAGDGTFERAPASHSLVRDTTYSGSATWGDYDNDGDLDVFVGDQRGADNRLYRNEGGGSFVRVREGPVVSDGGRTFSAIWVDVDGDGWLDLHALNGRDGDGGEADFLYRNRGDGTFARVEDGPLVAGALPSGGATWADYDNDGDQDVFLPVYTPGASRLYRNDGGWSFTEVTADVGVVPGPLPALPRTSVAHWVDFDNDADLDLFVGSTGGYMDMLYENQGDGGFRRVTAGRLGLDGTYVSDATWADVDNDADVDLVIGVWGGASELYLNDGSGGFEPADGGELGDVVGFVSSVSAGDLEGDGDLDLYLTQWPINDAGGAGNLLYRNESAAGNWIRVRLEGTTSNRSAVGAELVVRAEVDGAPRRQLRHVSARTSWRASGVLAQHFGLGDAERVEEIEVWWPSGRMERIPGPIGVNRTVTIVEGEGLGDDGPDDG